MEAFTTPVHFRLSSWKGNGIVRWYRRHTISEGRGNTAKDTVITTVKLQRDRMENVLTTGRSSARRYRLENSTWLILYITLIHFTN